MKKKLTLDLSALEVQSFVVPPSYDAVKGTVQGQMPLTEQGWTECLDCTTHCVTHPANTCGLSVCEPETSCADCTSEWLCGATHVDTCQCPTQTPGDTVCYDTITCCEQRP